MNIKKLTDEKDVTNLIRALQTTDRESRYKAWKVLLGIQKKDWEACKNAAEALKNSSGNEDDSKALIQFSHLLFTEAQDLSHKGNETDIEIRKEEIQAYDRALEINPKHASCLNNQGVTYMQLKDWDAAVECFEKAIGVEPGYNPDMEVTSSYYKGIQAKAWANKAVSLWNAKRFEEALEAVEEAVKHDSSIKGTREWMMNNMPYRKITFG